MNPLVHRFTYEVLKTSFPALDGVKVRPDRKEMYMEDAEFVQVMGVTKAEFEGLKKFKRDDLKKKAGLF